MGSDGNALDRRVILIGTAMTAATLAISMVQYALIEQIEPIRLFTLTSILLIGVREVFGQGRLWLVSRVVAVLMSLLSLIDVVRPAELGGAPPVVMVGMLSSRRSTSPSPPTPAATGSRSWRS